MTEAEWIACTDPRPMLEFLRGKASDRKLRLFAVACCNRINRLLSNRDSQEAIEFVKRHVEKGVVRRKGRPAIQRAAYKAHAGTYHTGVIGPEGIERAKCLIAATATGAACWALSTDPNDAARLSSYYSAIAVGWEALVASRPDSYADLPDSCKRPEQIQQAALLRCIFGNPFRSVSIEPAALAWNDGTISKLAQTIYDDRRFEDMPILADALEEAGCNAADILTHCRSEGPHVRGCWAVDLILSKDR
jgi:hypothetical protein